MAFGKKKKGADTVDTTVSEAPAAESADNKAKAAKPRRRRTSELLSSVVTESVVSSAVADMRENEAFLLPNGTPVILGLPVANIGGLSIKTKGDEAKGSIVELIRANHLSVFVNEAMLNDETLGFITDPDTLSRMGEFDLLREADYAWATVTVSEDGESADVNAVAYASYEDAVAISSGDKTLRDVFSDALWEWGGGKLEDDEDEDDLLVDESDEDEIVDSDDEGFEDDFAAEIEDEAPEAEPEAEAAPEEAEFEEPDTFEVEEPQPLVDPEDDSDYANYVRDNEEKEFDESEVRSTLVRRFLSNDLDLSFDLDGFDRIFASAPKDVAFDLDNIGEGWLADQLKQLLVPANAELKRMHIDHIDALRQRYVSLLSTHAQQVAADMDVTREGSYYKALFQGAETDRNSALETAAREAVELRKELDAEFDAEAQRRGEQARVEAENRWRDRNRPQHVRRLQEVDATIAKRIDDTFSSAQQTLLQVRRTAADMQFEVGHTHIIELLQQQHEEQSALEQELVERWSQELRDFVDEHRKSDVSRIDALREQQAREDTVSQVRAETQARIEELEATRARQIQELEDRLTQERSAAVSQMDLAEKRHASELEAKAKIAENATEQATTVIEQTKSTTEEMRRSHERELQQYKDREQAREIEDRRSRRSMVVVAAVAVIAALAGGAVAGVGVASNWFGNADQEVRIIETPAQ